MPSELQTVTDEIIALRTKRPELVEQLNEINRASGERLTPGQQERWDKVEKGIANLDSRMDELSTVRDGLLAGRAQLMKSAIAVTGDGARAVGEFRERFNVGGRFDVSDTIRAALGAGGTETAEGGRLLTDAARASIDGWTTLRSDIKPEWQESAVRAVSATGADAPYSRGVARHIAVFSDPQYVSAFDSFMRGGTANLSAEERRVMVAAERAAWSDRAMNEGSVAAGQAIVPPFLDPSIILTNTGIQNPFRQLCTIKTIQTQVWKGVTSAGVTAEWTAEAAEMTDASPTFVQPTITPIRGDAYIQASFEVLEDTSLATDVAMLFADARDRLEGTAFATGTGSTQPFGIVTELNLTTASRTAANTNGSFGAVDVFNLDSALPARYRPNASFLAHPGIYNLCRQFATGPSPQNAAFLVDFGGALPTKMLGRPIFESSAMQGTLSAATASSDDILILGDFRQGMFIVDRIGMQVGTIPFIMGANRRPTGEVGFAAWFRTGAAVVNADAFRMLVA